MINNDENHAANGYPRTFLILSSCRDPWGGSEELWSNAAMHLVRAGHRVYVIKTRIDFDNKRIQELTEAGITIKDFLKVPFRKASRVMRRAVSKRWFRYIPEASQYYLAKTIHRLRPDLTLISLGLFWDGLDYTEVCHRLQVPYTVICHKASDQYWPSDNERKSMLNVFSASRGNYFVSEHNRELTELQIGARLPGAEVVRNPFLTPVAEPLPWPETSDERLRLACVARMLVLDKGQDILLRVLAQDKWKARSLEVTFYGKGPDREGMEQMAALLDIKNVHFAGFTQDVTDIWRTHHGLVLSSRAEGLPLSLVEAMYCGRPSIVTNVGGNAEVIEDNETGFVATGASVHEFDAALERAWQRRTEWKEIGLLAAARIRTLMPDDPGGVFTAKLLQLCDRV